MTSPSGDKVSHLTVVKLTPAGNNLSPCVSHHGVKNIITIWLSHIFTYALRKVTMNTKFVRV